MWKTDLRGDQLLGTRRHPGPATFRRPAHSPAGREISRKTLAHQLSQSQIERLRRQAYSPPMANTKEILAIITFALLVFVLIRTLGKR